MGAIRHGASVRRITCVRMRTGVAVARSGMRIAQRVARRRT